MPSISKSININQRQDRQKTYKNGPNIWTQDFSVFGSGFQETMAPMSQAVQAARTQMYSNIMDPSTYQGSNQRNSLNGNEPIYGNTKYERNPLDNCSQTWQVRKFNSQTEVTKSIDPFGQMFRTPSSYPYQGGSPWYTQYVGRQ